MKVSTLSFCAHLKNAIHSGEVIRHHRAQRRGGMGGQALSPSSCYQCFILHILEKEFYTAEKNSSTKIKKI